jgi:hypothetical protein
MMTFYSSRGAPNPRRVEIFMAEHGLFEGQVCVSARSQLPALALPLPLHVMVLPLVLPLAPLADAADTMSIHRHR